MQSNLTRLEACRVLLRSGRIETFQRKVRTSSAWAEVYRGFRPQTLTRSTIVRFAPVFAKTVALQRSLQQHVLDNLGISPNEDLQSRWSLLAAGDVAQTELLSLASILSAIQLGDLPEQATAADEPPFTDDRASEELLSGLHEESSKSSVEEDVADHVIAPAATTPVFVATREELDWEAPADDVAEAQAVTTLFERCMLAFLLRQLQGLHGEAWLRLGCGRWKKAWRERSPKATDPSTDRELEPRTLLGYAHLAEYAEIIKNSVNWPAFAPYFIDRDWFQRTYERIAPIRVAGMHAADRDIRLVSQASRLEAMADIVSCFHKPTAARIADIYDHVVLASHDPEDSDQVEVAAGGLTLTNIADFSDPELIGRASELRSLEEFWQDDFTRILSITGQGGVGKTAVLDRFIWDLLTRLVKKGERASPEAILYLTAKDNYLDYMTRASRSVTFKTARRIFEATLEMVGEPFDDAVTEEDLRRRALNVARDFPTLFALDNLESLSPKEYEAVRNFLDDLPRPSKALLTTRIDRRIGRLLSIDGLPEDDGVALITRRLLNLDLSLNETEGALVRDLVEYTSGLPLALVYATNAMINGKSLSEVLESTKGGQFLNLLAFSFDSSIKELIGTKLLILAFLAMSKAPRTRKELLRVAKSEEELDEALQGLRDMSFMRSSRGDQRRSRFIIDNEMLRDYILERAPHILSEAEHQQVMKEAKVLAAPSRSASIEIERALQSARRTASDGWGGAAAALEEARGKWGDDPRLLAQLGYYQYRLQHLDAARHLMESAINKGLEDSETFANLALVLYHQRAFHEGLQRAETAIALRQHYPLADQIAGECLVGIAERDRLLLGHETLTGYVNDGIKHLSRSMRTEERGLRDEQFNARSQRTIQRAEALLQA